MWAYRDSKGSLYPIHSVRILPMAERSLPDTPVTFLKKIVPERGGKYYFYRHSMAAPVGAFVLFQFKKHIIGHALCVGEEKYASPDASGYNGYFLFLPESIMLYAEPLTQEQVHGMDASITKLFQTVWKVNPAALPTLFRHVLLPQLRQRILAAIGTEREEITGTEQPAVFPVMEVVEGKLKESLSSRYERNPAARRLCLQYYSDLHGGRTVCEICGLEFSAKYGDAFQGFIHVHHLNPVASFDGEHSINPCKDLIPICPNCHAVAHRRTPPYTPDDIRAMLNRSNAE